MSFLDRLLGRTNPNQVQRPAYDAVIAHARDPWWYRHGGVADSIDGRFEMVMTMLALVLLRLERDGTQRQAEAYLTELFVTDMEGQLRETGFGDPTVGKYVGKQVSMLGGRIGAYRAAWAEQEPLGAALVRNLWRGDAPADIVQQQVIDRLRTFVADMDARPADGIAAGDLPPLRNSNP